MKVNYWILTTAALMACAAAFGQAGLGRGWRAAAGLCPLQQQTPPATAQSEDMTKLREQIDAKRTELNQLWKADKPDAEKIKAANKELLDLRGQLADKMVDLWLSAADAGFRPGGWGLCGGWFGRVGCCLRMNALAQGCCGGCGRGWGCGPGPGWGRGPCRR